MALLGSGEFRARVKLRGRRIFRVTMMTRSSLGVEIEPNAHIKNHRNLK